LEHTLPAFKFALEQVTSVAEKKKESAFVGTSVPQEKSLKSKPTPLYDPYVDHTAGWVGLTNYKTIRGSIKNYAIFGSSRN